MENIFDITFCCNNNCNIFYENHHIGSTSSDDNIFHYEFNKHIIILELHPKSPNQWDYFIPTKIIINLFSDTSDGNYELINLLDNCYEIDLYPRLFIPTQSNTSNIFEKESGDYKIKVLKGKKYLIQIKNKKQEAWFYPKIEIGKEKCEITKNGYTSYFIFSSSNSNKDYCLVCPLGSTIEVWEKTANTIEVVFPKITALSYCNDSLGHAYVEKYEVKTDGLHKLEYYSTYKNKEPLHLFNQAFIPKAFFECILCKDFNKARSFLNEELNGKLSNEHLENFFPSFVRLKKCPKRENTFLLLGTNNNYFSVEIKNQKINNIVELDLSNQANKN